MFFRELHEFARKSLKGHYIAAFRTALLCPTVYLLGKAVPVLLGAILIARGNFSPKALFLGEHPLWILFGFLWSVLLFCILLPVECGVRSWFTALLGLETQRRIYFRTASGFFRAAFFFGRIILLRWLALFPAAAAFAGACLAFRKSTGQAEGGFWLFFAVQGILAAVWCGLFYLRFSVGLTAVPYLYLENPEISVWSAVQQSRHMLAAQHRKLFGLLLDYIPLFLPVVTIPFLMPYLFADVTLFLQIRMKEYAQESAQTEAVYG